MKRLFAAVAIVSALGAALPAAAEEPMTGHWALSGKVASFAFSVACDFQQTGQTLTGVCVDVAASDARIKSGRRHVLSGGTVDGDRVTWSYPSSFLFSHFSADYAGVRQGERISGQITAQGHTGPFSGARSAP